MFPYVRSGNYFYFIVEFVEPRPYILVAPPLVMDVDSACNVWRHLALVSTICC